MRVKDLLVGFVPSVTHSWLRLHPASRMAFSLIRISMCGSEIRLVAEFKLTARVVHEQM
jgi:hypothetical protein